MLGLPLRLTAGAFDKLTAHKLSSTHLRIEVMLNVGELEGNASSGLGMGSSKLEIFGICNPSVCRGGGCGLAAEQREMLDLLSIANAPFFPQRGIGADGPSRRLARGGARGTSGGQPLQSNADSKWLEI
jgi:hypothetical protein